MQVIQSPGPEEDLARLRLSMRKHQEALSELTTTTLKYGSADFEMKTFALLTKRHVFVFNVASPLVTVYTPDDVAPGHHTYIPITNLRPNPETGKKFFDPEKCIGLIYDASCVHYNAWLP